MADGATELLVTGPRPDPALDDVRGRARVFTDHADHALVQQRMGLLYGVLGAIVGGFYLAGGVTAAVLMPDRAVAFHLSAPKLIHLGTVAVLITAFLLCRGAPRPRWVLSLLDIGALVTTVACVALMMSLFPSGTHFESFVVAGFLLVTMLRAALVPSPPRWTALVAALAGSPVPFATYRSVMRDAYFSSEVPRAAEIVLISALTVAGVFAAWVIGRVVYGLRAEVKNAMRLGQYTLEEKIGEGGMGVVYRATHALLRRPTAVKLLSADRTDALSVRKFEREVQLTSMLTHPNTIAIYDFGHTRRGVFYYAMELLDGVTLQELVEQDGPQPPARVVHLVTQVASALAEAHAAGLVHRDVKPANVFVCERGGMPDFVKVLDFGLVKDQQNPDASLSTTNAITGTPLYMAPESITRPKEVDGRVDLYALGAVAYFLLTGAPPFEGSNLVEICSNHLHVAPVPPSARIGRPVPPLLEALVLRCLSKEPEGRPSSASSLVAELETVAVASGSWGPSDAHAWWGRWVARNGRRSVAQRRASAKLPAQPAEIGARELDAGPI